MSEAEFRAELERRLETVRPPEGMTELRAEYWKAGARAVIREVNAMLASPAPSPARVPEGWVLVPREPTAAMLDAALRLQGDDAFLARSPAVLSAFVKIYRAMLAATPAPSPARGDDDAAARKLYNDSQRNVHNLHTLAWSELTEATRDEWRKKATGAAR